jgi:2-methylcitrate dehydratase PrpD
MKNHDRSVTAALCQAIVSTTFEVLPRQVVEIAKRIVLDGIAVAVAGSVEEGPRIVAEHVKSLGGTASSTVLGASLKLNGS